MKKRVLFVVESLAGGGAEKILCNIVKHLNKEKYEVTILSVVKTGIYVDNITKDCRLMWILPEYGSLRNPLERIKYKITYKEIYHAHPVKVYRSYIKESFDIEIAFVEGFATKLVAASTNCNSRKYAWLHTDMNRNPHADSRYHSLQEHRGAYEKFNKVIAVSDIAAKAFEEKFHIYGKTEVYYNPVDSLEIKALAGERRNRDASKSLSFVTAGRLVEQKGYDRLLDAMKRLKQDGFVFSLEIIGEGIDRKKLEQQAVRDELGDFIHFAGFQANPYPLMIQADAFVISSRAEGFSTAATEALILNIPIITTECAGMKELFGEYECGRIVENSSEGIYRGMKEVLSHPGKLELYKRNQSIRAQDFSIEKGMKSIEELLDE